MRTSLSGVQLESAGQFLPPPRKIVGRLADWTSSINFASSRVPATSSKSHRPSVSPAKRGASLDPRRHPVGPSGHSDGVPSVELLVPVAGVLSVPGSRAEGRGRAFTTFRKASHNAVPAGSVMAAC